MELNHNFHVTSFSTHFDVKISSKTPKRPSTIQFSRGKGLLDSRFRVVVKSIFKKPEEKNKRDDLIGGLNLIFESKSFSRSLFTVLELNFRRKYSFHL